ncbi:S8 family serine peptidase [Streptomyces sp. NPDC013433]|uniref:S8 family serine peptidase n=1 Tax=Streptomyces sp. NPDC013433 TaxID=3155604 RepID=UPI003451AA6C
MAWATVLALSAAGGSTGVPAVPSASWSSAEAGAPSAVPRTVTLVTGDRAHVDAQGRVTGVTPGKGRHGIPITRKIVQGHTYVVPLDASRLLGSGTLDRRLFDVTELLAAGYDDARRDTLPLIISYAGSASRAKSALSEADVTVTRALPAVDGASLRVPKESAVRTWNALTDGSGAGQRVRASGVRAIWLDGVRHASLDRSAAQIGAPQAWQAGWTGEGVRVAVLDTGVDQTHPDLADAEVAERNFSESADNVDRGGHGTHVASVITGSGARSGGRFKGVAPDARILDGKVLDDSGSGYDSGILAGIDWAVAEGARVVNMSLGAADAPGLDPLELAVNRYSEEEGILFAVAAGNSGPGAGTLDSPGSAAQALTVGAVDRADAVADFSGTGPTADGALKPDIAAPGVGIVAAKAAEGYQGDPAEDGYVTMSGTSMAAPHVAGAAALLVQQHPGWSGRRIKRALTSSAVAGRSAGPFLQGSGRLDVARAAGQTVIHEQDALDFGLQRWPHADDQVEERRLTYRNLSDAPVTLDLAVAATGPDGKAAPAGLFSLNARQVTVPGGGTADVTVAADTSAEMPDDVYGGVVVATAGDRSVRTALVVHREAESYDVTLRFVDTDGAAAAAGATVVGLDNDVFETPQADDGEVTVRLARGTYSLEAPVHTGDVLALLVRPELALTADTTIVFDAGKARPVSIGPPDTSAVSDIVAFGWRAQLGAAASPVHTTWFAESYDKVTMAQVGPPATRIVFRSQISGGWTNGERGYDLVYARDGSLFTGFTHQAQWGELARLDVRNGEPALGKWGTSLAMWDDGVVASGLGLAKTTLPGVTQHYVTPARGARWQVTTSQFSATDEPEGDLIGALRDVRPGRTYAYRFNVGVFGPSTDTASPWKAGIRVEDGIQVCVPMFNDGRGNRANAVVSSARTTITAGGETVIDEPSQPCGMVTGLPDRRTTYRISTDITRSATVARVSTRVEADWTFTSRRPAAGAEAALPLSTVRFAPPLSPASTARAGHSLRVPLTVEGAAAGGHLGRLTVRVSYDDGRTWRRAPVSGDERKSVLLHHPRGARTVSLRTEVSDKRGNVGRQTIHSAYRLTK